MLIGLDVALGHVQWPDNNRLNDALEFAAPQPHLTAIGYIQVQLWIGLREMTRHHADEVIVPASSGEKILALWKNAEGFTDRHKALNTLMINWLERCAQHDWMLIPDATPLVKVS